MKKQQPLTSIIIPHYNNDISILKKVLWGAVKQEYKNKEVILVIDDPKKKRSIIPQKLRKKIKIIKNQKNLGLAGSLNKGINNSKGEIIVALLEDCVPKNEKWLASLVKPLESPEVIATASYVENDKGVFNNYEPLVKDIIQDKKEGFTPKLGERGCAYRRDVLEKVGLFDSEHFRTAGEDMDIRYRLYDLPKKGKIIKGNKPSVVHMHPLNLNKIYKMGVLYSSTAGVLTRLHKKKFFNFKEFLKLLFPLWGIAKGIKTPATYSKNKYRLIKIYIKLNWIHLVNFIPFFIKGKQE